MSKIITIVSSVVSLLSLSAMVIMATQIEPRKKEEPKEDDHARKPYHCYPGYERKFGFRLKLTSEDVESVTYDDVFFPDLNTAVLDSYFAKEFESRVDRLMPKMLDQTDEDIIVIDVEFDKEMVDKILDNGTEETNPANRFFMAKAVRDVLSTIITKCAERHFPNVKRLHVVHR